MQRWSNHLAETLRTLLRRGVLFLLVAATAVLVTVSPLVTRPASAAITDLGLGGNSCAIETVGWVICPTMRSIARLADKGFTYINKSSLNIDYQLFGNSGKTFQAWEVMRNIANGLFVIVFLYMIYSYLVGRVNGSYSLKRLLPRLLVAVIAINLSYSLGVILIDISNIIGDAVWTIMKGIYGNGSPVMPLGASANPLSDGNITKMTAAAMGNTAMVWVLMPPLAAIAITVATISAATVILLIMREAVVAALVLAAPILIALYLLPNMEKFAGQALRLFIQLLILYPVIAILLGTGQIVSLAAGGWSNQSAPYGGGTGSIVPDLVAAGAAVVPLLGIWFLFKNMSSLMSAAGSRLSATVAGRKGGKDDEKARVTGKATVGAANAKNTNGVGNGFGNRRQAFTRNRRRSSLGGSSLTGDTRQGNRLGQSSEEGVQNVAQNSLDAGLRVQDETTQKRLEELENGGSSTTNNNTTELEEKKGMGDTVATAVLGAKGREDDKKDESISAKDIFNNMNRSHESKDKDRKFGAGPAPAGGSGPAAGSAQPTAPSTGYRAPEIAQNSNIISGTSAGQTPIQVVAVPVQIDASSLLGQNHTPLASQTPGMPAPASGIEEKAKARAQKYLFDTERDLDEARNRQDILGGKTKEKLTEPPHAMAGPAKNDDRDDSE